VPPRSQSLPGTVAAPVPVEQAVNPAAVATAFRVVAVAEALSWVGLLAGMYVKYVPETSELGVQVFGPVHGAVFLAYVAVALLASRVLRWSPGTALVALAAAVPPLVTVAFERWATRTGRLASRTARAAR
jgi:integral membrane protein